MKTKSNNIIPINPAKLKLQHPFFQKQEEVIPSMPEHKALNTANTTSTPTPFFQKPTRPTIQTKLTIGQPGDPYEQEADAMAEKVVGHLSAGSHPEPAGQVNRKVQRKCESCEEDELQMKEGEVLPEIKRKPIFESESGGALQMKCAACEEDETALQPKATSDAGSNSANMSHIESSLSSSKGGGSPLPDDTRSQMEGTFGADFSGVRVHTGSTAVQMNRDLRAQAFTHGSDVYFNSGKYDAGSTEGKRLLGHELTHVVQQGGGEIKKQELPSQTTNFQENATMASEEQSQLKMHGDLAQRPTPMGCQFDPSFSSNDGEFNFLKGSADVSALSVAFDSFKKRWHQHGGNSNIILHGFASVDGPEGRNWILSCMRAFNVRDALALPCIDGSPGIPSNFIEIFAQGETNQFSKDNPNPNRVVKISSSIPVIPPPPPAPPQACGPLKIWINAFIPQNVSGYTYPVSAGSHAGKTAIPCPSGLANIPNPNCHNLGYLTDQRTFDSIIPTGASTPSVRMRSLADIDIVSLRLSPTHESSGTVEVAKHDFGIFSTTHAGDVTCSLIANMGGCRFVDHLRGDSTNNSTPFTLGTLDYQGAASDPCVNMAADIDYEGTITIHVNPVTNIVRVEVDGFIDEFPAFEMYAAMNGVVKTIKTAPPPAGNTVMDLLGGANTAFSGNAEFSCQYPLGNISESPQE